MPKRIGDYLIGEKLGEGGFGLVHKAFDERTTATVALKLVPRADHALMRALDVEVEWLGAVNRPNIVKIYGRGENADFAWLVLEFIEGRTLLEIMEEHAGSGRDRPENGSASRSGRRQADLAYVQRLMGWMRDIARALHTLHEHAGIHRDIKPSNVVIHESGLAYLIDFGLGLGVTESEIAVHMREFAGTVEYMSPEQASYQRLEPSSDLYSLAVTFYEAVTASRVVTTSEIHAARKQVIEDDVPPPSERNPTCPATLDPIFVTALRKRERDRYASALNLADDIDRWLDGRPPEHAALTPRLRKRRRIVRAAAGVTLGFVLMVAGFFGKGIYDGRCFQSELVGTLDHLRGLRSQGRLDDAEAECRRVAPRFGGEARYLDVWQSIEGAWFPHAVRAFERGIRITTPDPASLGPLRAMADEARRCRRHVDAPSYRFRIAGEAVLDDAFREALEVIGGEPGSRTSAEEELRAMAYLGSGDHVQYARCLRVVEDPERLRLSGPNEDFLSAWRLLWEARKLEELARRNETLPPLRTPPVLPPELYARAGALLDGIEKKAPDRDEVQSLRAAIHLGRGEFVLASDLYCRIYERMYAASNPERAGTGVLIVLSSFLASRTDPVNCGALRERARGHAAIDLALQPASVRYLLRELWRYGGCGAVDEWLRQDWVPAWLPVEALEVLPGLARARWDEIEHESLPAHAGDFDLVGDTALTLLERMGSVNEEAVRSAADAQFFRLCARKLAIRGAGTSPEAKSKAAQEIGSLWPRLRRCANELSWDPAFALLFGLAQNAPASPDGEERERAVREAWSVVEPLVGRWRSGLDGAELAEFEDELEQIEVLLRH